MNGRLLKALGENCKLTGEGGLVDWGMDWKRRWISR